MFRRKRCDYSDQYKFQQRKSDVPDAHGGRRGRNSTSEVYIRNMLDAWLALMTKGQAAPVRAAS